MIRTLAETFKYAGGLNKIVDHSTPAQLIFFVTNKCNSRCQHCFYWKELNTGVKEELTLREIKKISQSMGNIFWLFISGGEPFLRTDLPEIIQAFYKNNHPRSVVIPTNGLLEKLVVAGTQKIAGDCPGLKVIIQISIDGIGSEHDKLRGVEGNYQKVARLIPKLQKLQQKHPNLAVQINAVFARHNQSRITEIYDTLTSQLKPDNICVSLIRGNPKEVGVKNIDFKKYLAAHGHLRNTRRFSHYSPLLSFLITKKEEMQIDIFEKSSREKKAVVPCLAGRQSVVLYPDGRLKLCELRDDNFGNLRDVGYDFKKLWQSEKAVQIRKKVKGCYCTQECVYTVNVFLNPRVWPVFLKYLIRGKI